MFLKNEFSNRLVQVSFFSAIVYYITAYPVVFESARKYFPIKFKKTHHLLIFHTFVFIVLMYVLTYFVFYTIEGAQGGGGATGILTCPSPGKDGKVKVWTSDVLKGLDNDRLKSQAYKYTTGDGTCEKPYRSDQITLQNKGGASVYSNLTKSEKKGGVWDDSYTCTEQKRTKSGKYYDDYATHGRVGNKTSSDCSSKGGYCMGVDGDPFCYCAKLQKEKAIKGTYFINQNNDSGEYELLELKFCNSIPGNISS